MLIKPVQFLQHVIHGPGGGAATTRVVQPESHPVRSLFQPAGERFVRMPGESVLCQKPVQSPDSTAQVMTCAREYQKVIHKPGIAKVFLSGKETVGIRQVKSGEKRAEGGCTGNAFTGCVKGSPVLNAVMNELIQELTEYRVGDVTAELVVQEVVADGGIIPADVGPANKAVSVAGDGLAGAQEAAPAPAVPGRMFAARRERQERTERESQRGDDGRVFSGPYGNSIAILPTDKGEGSEPQVPVFTASRIAGSRSRA